MSAPVQLTAERRAAQVAAVAAMTSEIDRLVRRLVPAERRAEAKQVARIGVLVALHRTGGAPRSAAFRRAAVAAMEAEIATWLQRTGGAT